MNIDILTLFPEMFRGPFQESIIKRAAERGLVDISVHDLRDYATDKHKMVDDYPFGGGGGMVLKPGPIFEAVDAIKVNQKLDAKRAQSNTSVVLLSPQGVVLNQRIIEGLKLRDNLILICGHYDGIDDRVTQQIVDVEISIGDYVLSGGEIPAMVLTDSIVRLIPGAVGDPDSLNDDSHTSGLLQFPQYTRPEVYSGLTVPSVLLSGDHRAVEIWRRQQSLLKTQKVRPDLLGTAPLDSNDLEFLETNTSGDVDS
ncbi:uncharacterized protein METZ01_LOCUS189385 [marine metagenome]|uniref:tRNA (guanine-N(1)-)-methyltransferase n=1 Tax=marine metagenome TaxID=408172 RepID=A0A382DFS6_9ZZZZ